VQGWGHEGSSAGIQLLSGHGLSLGSMSWAGAPGSVPSLGPFTLPTQDPRIIERRAGTLARTQRRRPILAHPKHRFPGGQEHSGIAPLALLKPWAYVPAGCLAAWSLPAMTATQKWAWRSRGEQVSSPASSQQKLYLFIHSFIQPSFRDILFAQS